MRPGLLLCDCSILKVLLRHYNSIKTLRDGRLKDIVGNTFVAKFSSCSEHSRTIMKYEHKLLSNICTEKKLKDRDAVCDGAHKRLQKLLSMQT